MAAASAAKAADTVGGGGGGGPTVMRSRFAGGGDAGNPTGATAGVGVAAGVGPGCGAAAAGEAAVCGPAWPGRAGQASAAQGTWAVWPLANITGTVLSSPSAGPATVAGCRYLHALGG